MSVHPQIHIGYESIFVISDPIQPNVWPGKDALYPLESRLNAPTRCIGECIRNNPSGCGKMFACCLAPLDTMGSVAVTLIDLLWAFLGWAWFGCKSHVISPQPKQSNQSNQSISNSQHSAQAFRIATLNSVGRLCINLTWGVVMMFRHCGNAFSSRQCTPLFISVLYLPFVWPFTCLWSLWHLCFRSAETGARMVDQVDRLTKPAADVATAV